MFQENIHTRSVKALTRPVPGGLMTSDIQSREVLGGQPLDSNITFLMLGDPFNPDKHPNGLPKRSEIQSLYAAIRDAKGRSKV